MLKPNIAIPRFGLFVKAFVICWLTLFLTNGLGLLHSAHAVETITVTVDNVPNQTFRGFGFQLNSAGFMTHTKSAEVQQLLYEDLNTRYLRLLVRPDTSTQSATQRFIADYVTSGLIANARSHGVSTVLMNPTASASAPSDAVWTQYSTLISLLTSSYSTTIDYCSLQNEPSTAANWNGAATAAAIHNFRSQLDALGLNAVKIVALDSSNADSTWLNCMTGTKNDPTTPQAWGELGAMSNHSYNMAATTSWANLDTTKDYWQTEAGWQTPSFSGAANRFLSDMNHRISVWFWYLGAMATTTSSTENNHRLIMLNTDGTYTINPTYYFLKQLTESFPIGSVFRLSSSDKALPKQDMVWTYGRKPAINVAAAVAPDGSWRVGLANYTQDNAATTYSSYYARNSYDVTLNLTGLAGTGTVLFDVTRTMEDESNVLTKTMQRGETLNAVNGQVVVRVDPRELVTLREIIPVATLDMASNTSISAEGCTPHGLTYGTGYIGNGALFSGATTNGSYVDLPLNAGSSSAGSISFWINTTQVSAEPVHLYYGSTSSYGDGFGVQAELHLNMTSDGRPQFYIYSSDKTKVVSIAGPTAINDGAWHAVSASWKAGETARLWVDGVKVGEVPHNAPIFDFTAIHRLGRPGTTTRKFTGTLDEVLVLPDAIY